jgi:hypothetical protein
MSRQYLPIPLDAIVQHVIILGKTGSGKSSKMRVIVEYVLETAGVPSCIIDPKGDWWGLRSTSGGKQSGYPIVIFGGEHGDVPINARAGAYVAELVATGSRSCLIDLGGWTVSDRTRFFIDFASTLFRVTKGKRYLFVDECHNFAPQGKILSPEAGEMLHWANRLASEGRGKGLTIIGASQRPQKVHKDFLTSCETLIACRMIHKLDRDAIKDWIDGCADPQMGKEVMADLANMQRKESWVWSPEIDFGPKKITWDMFRTFDSFKIREIDSPKLKGWAEVDLAGVKDKLQSIVDEAFANDPKELRKQVASLKKELDAERAKKTQKGKAEVTVNPVILDVIEFLEKKLPDSVPVKSFRDLHETFLSRMRLEIDRMHALEVRDCQRSLDDLVKATRPMLAKLRKVAGDAPASTTSDKESVLRTARIAEAFVTGGPIKSPEGGDEVRGLQKRILNALRWLELKGIAPAPRPSVGAVAGVVTKSGYFKNTAGAMNTAGLISYPEKGLMLLTDAGRAASDDVDDTGTVYEQWLKILSGLEREIVVALNDAYPHAMHRKEIGEVIGKEHESGYFKNTMGRLHTIGAVDYPQKGFVKLSKYVMTE